MAAEAVLGVARGSAALSWVGGARCGGGRRGRCWEVGAALGGWAGEGRKSLGGCGEAEGGAGRCAWGMLSAVVGCEVAAQRGASAAALDREQARGSEDRRLGAGDRGSARGVAARRGGVRASAARRAGGAAGALRRAELCGFRGAARRGWGMLLGA